MNPHAQSTATTAAENHLFHPGMTAECRGFLLARFEEAVKNAEADAARAVTERWLPSVIITGKDFGRAVEFRDAALAALLDPEDLARLKALSAHYGLCPEQTLSQAVAERLADLEPEHPLCAAMTGPVNPDAEDGAAPAPDARPALTVL